MDCGLTGDVNNAAVTSKCGADPVTVGPQISEITPIAATCAQFASGFATSMPSYQYTLSGSKIAHGHTIVVHVLGQGSVDRDLQDHAVDQ